VDTLSVEALRLQLYQGKHYQGVASFTKHAIAFTQSLLNLVETRPGKLKDPTVATDTPTCHGHFPGAPSDCPTGTERRRKRRL
jgi:hypothetical protein